MRQMLVLGLVLLVGCDGPRGNDGTDGKDGAPGADGTNGATGKPGAKGADGAPGVDGADGARGLTGKPGPVGERGERGLRGAPGGDEDGGTDYRPAVWIGCTAYLDIVDAANTTAGQDGIFETAFIYEVTLFANGDAHLGCRTNLGSLESADGGGYFPAGTQGAANGLCATSIDYPPFGGTGSTVGIWNFTVPSTGPRVTYRDPDAAHPLDGSFYAFKEADCNTRVDRGAGWTQTTLAALFN